VGTGARVPPLVPVGNTNLDQRTHLVPVCSSGLKRRPFVSRYQSRLDLRDLRSLPTGTKAPHPTSVRKRADKISSSTSTNFMLICTYHGLTLYGRHITRIKYLMVQGKLGTSSGWMSLGIINYLYKGVARCELGDVSTVSFSGKIFGVPMCHQTSSFPRLFSFVSNTQVPRW
jgi:hypothetical protein